MPEQNYEEYWKITNAFTDYNGEKFLNTLRACITFIDSFINEPYSDDKYLRLQNLVSTIIPISPISIRKSINQFVKMGFINPFLVSYHPQAKEYLEARTNKKRKTLLSKIIYSNSSFNRSVNNLSPVREINFLIRTLIENGKLSKEEIAALMLIDIESFGSDFINADQLQAYVVEVRRLRFMERKYNQVRYLCNLLGKLDNLVFVGSDLYFKEDAEHIFGEDLGRSGRRRDPYLHHLYKNQLQEESYEIYGKNICFLEKLQYPVLIASHIKPFIESGENEAYDPNNGLLLSRTIDSLFDLKFISFSDDGHILFSNRISQDVLEFWQNYKLDPIILNNKRKEYLKYHRQLMRELEN